MAATASKQVGALWRHTAKQGDIGEYLKGTLDLGALGSVPIVVFQNHRKQKENEPDYRIVLSAPPDRDKAHGDSQTANGEDAEAEAPAPVARKSRK